MPFKKYYHLTKPGIIYGNLLAAIAAFLFAAIRAHHFNLGLFAAMVIGLSLVIASACVFNNIYDTDIDVRMERTKNRELVTKSISKKNAQIFGAVLLILGIIVIYFYINTLTLITALIAFIFYVSIYTPLKRRTVYNTLIGAVSGAIPPVVGYLSVTNHVDKPAIILFLILFFWQMPHFYAIAIRRLEEYRAAKIPVLPVVDGVRVTKVHMLFFIIAFMFSVSALASYRYEGNAYIVVMALLSAVWLWLALKGFKTVSVADDVAWAKKMFLFSLLILTIFCFVLPIAALLP